MKDWRELLIDLEKMLERTWTGCVDSHFLRDRQADGRKEGRRGESGLRLRLLMLGSPQRAYCQSARGLSVNFLCLLALYSPDIGATIRARTLFLLGILNRSGFSPPCVNPDQDRYPSKGQRYT